MTTRTAVLLLVLGGGLLIGGTVLAVALHDFTVFSFPVTSWVDVAGSSAVAAFGLVLVLVGIRGALRAKRQRGTL